MADMENPFAEADKNLAHRMRQDMVEKQQPAADLSTTQAAGEQTWTTEELQRDFEVLGFLAPFVVVRRKSDGKRGSLEFTHSPRVYFGFKPDIH